MAETRWERAPERICGILDQTRTRYCTELRGHTGDHVAKALTAEAEDYDTLTVLHRWPQREVGPDEPIERPLMRTRVITAEELAALQVAADETASTRGVLRQFPAPAAGATLVPDGPRPRRVRVILRKEDTFDVRLAIPAELAVEELSPEKVEEIITREVFDRSALAEITPKSSELVVVAVEEEAAATDQSAASPLTPSERARLQEALDTVDTEYFDVEGELLFEDADRAVHTLRNAIRCVLEDD